MAERRNKGTEQLQIVEEPVMNGTRVQRGTEMMNNLSVGLKRGTDISSEVRRTVVAVGKTRELVVAFFYFMHAYMHTLASVCACHVLAYSPF